MARRHVIYRHLWPLDYQILPYYKPVGIIPSYQDRKVKSQHVDIKHGVKYTESEMKLYECTLDFS